MVDASNPADYATMLGMGNSGSSSMIITTMWIAIGILVCIILGIVGYIIYLKLTQKKYKARIHVSRSGGKEKIIIGQVIRKKFNENLGTYSWFVKTSVFDKLKPITQPNDDCIEIEGKNEVIHLIKIENSFIPATTKVERDKISYMPMSYDMDTFTAMELKSRNEKYKPTIPLWQMLIPLIAFAMVVVLVIVVTYMENEQIGKISSTIAASNAETTKALQYVVRYTTAVAQDCGSTISPEIPDNVLPDTEPKY